MLFSSLTFIFVFLPLVLLTYFLIPRKGKNIVLLVGSVLFYAWGGVSYTIVLIFSVLMNFFFARKIGNLEKSKKKWLRVGLIFNIVLLVIFKYLDFFIENINGLFSLFSSDISTLSKTNIVLPLGISFFTFQQMSMLWDVYRDKSQSKINFLNTALYISFFPQLIAGPIVRYHDIIDQIKQRKVTWVMFHSGIQRFTLGLFKKIVFANTCGELADQIMDKDLSVIGTSAAWLGIVAYALQIYFDFSGYSDMAIGLGRMFGFRILENFNFPYISKSIKEFWRRWHISLSQWFRDYVYIPLGGNRKGGFRTYKNLFIVFLLTGFWHGATWSFVFWGIYHGVFLIIERLGFEKWLAKIPKPLSWMYSMIVVLIGWVFFRIESMADAFKYVGTLFGSQDANSVTYLHYLNRERIYLMVLAIVSCSTLFHRLQKYLNSLKTGYFYIPIEFFRIALVVILFTLSVMYINAGSYNPFIYFRF